jgi:hypothetical protein
MTEPGPVETMREMAREVLREVVPEILAEAAASASNSRPNGHARSASDHAPRVPATAAPLVPPPPVAAVLRPSTWTGPAVPGEVIGDGMPGSELEPRHIAATDGGLDPTLIRVKPHISAQNASGAPATDRVEPVTIDTDEDLARFVRALLVRLESPRDRRAIRSGRVRFTLRRSTATACGPGGTQATEATLRMAKGAVTERAVRDAAERGVTLILARGAVLTPLARDQARALGVEIEKEGRC